MSARTMSAGEGEPVGPRPSRDPAGRCAPVRSDSSTRVREIDVRDVDSTQVSASSSACQSSDQALALAPDDAHDALSELVGRWGLGGALAELQRVSAEHDGLPDEAEAVLAPLAMLVAAYATTGSATAALAGRADPCTICAAETRFLARMAEVARG